VRQRALGVAVLATPTGNFHEWMPQKEDMHHESQATV
jgi:hypothetical protein